MRASIDFSRKRHSSFRRLKGTKMENSSSCHRRSHDFEGESIQNHEICLRGCLLTLRTLANLVIQSSETPRAVTD